MRPHSTAAASSGSDRVSRLSSARVSSLLTIPATAYAGPALGGGPAPAASMKVCLASTKISGDLTTGVLIGAFIGSDSAQDDRVGCDADAESLSITRLEGSRWRGGRLWSRELGSESVSESESRLSAPWIDASRSVSVGVHGARGNNTTRDTSGSRHEHRGVWAHVVGWMPILVVRIGRHDVSKTRTKDTRASWCALRMGPRTIGAPQRGQDHADVAASVRVSDERWRSNRRASVSRAVRQ